MQGFTSKQDGLVNAGDISKTRVENPKDCLKRDQDVWVKVISLAGGRIRLSMRDVDQQSGRDLVPMGKPGEGESLSRTAQAYDIILPPASEEACMFISAISLDKSIMEGGTSHACNTPPPLKPPFMAVECFWQPIPTAALLVIDMDPGRSCLPVVCG